MLTDLPEKFLEQTKGLSRTPITLCHFIFPNNTFYLSDTHIGKDDGLPNDYLPLIEDWGQVKDSVRPRSIFEGDSLGAKSGTLTIINAYGASSIADVLRRYGIENTLVEIYQWFKTDFANYIDPVLIDSFIVRDPIVLDQKSMLVTLDIISPIMRSNAYLWGKEEDKGTRYPYVVGKATGVPMIDLETAPVTVLTEDVLFDDLGPIYVENALEFPETGTITIDSEYLTYDSRTNLSFNITERGAGGTEKRPHIRGARLFPKDSIFEFAVCRGPIQEISEMRGDDKVYVHPVEMFPGQDPVIVKFHGWPPYHTSAPGDPGPPIPGEPTDSTQYGTLTESFYGGGAGGYPTGADNINIPTGAARMEIVSVVDSRVPVNFTKTSGTGGSIPPDPLMHVTANSDFLHGYGVSESGMSPNDGNLAQCWINFDVPYSNFEVDYIRVNVDGVSSACSTAGTEGSVDIVAQGLDSYEPWYVYMGGSGCTNYPYQFQLSSYYDSHPINNVQVRLNVRADWAYTGIWGPSGSSGMQLYNFNVYVEGTVPFDGTVPKPFQELDSHFNRDLTDMGTLNSVVCLVKFSLQVSNATVETKIVYRGTPYTVDNRTLWNETNQHDVFVREIEVGVSARDWDQLKDTRVGIVNEFKGTELGTRSFTCIFESVTWIINYTPDDIQTPNEQRLLYVTDMVADVVSVEGEDLTPPEVVRNLIKTYTEESSRIDNAVFDDYRQKYIDSAYFLNGIIPGDYRFQDALKMVLHEGAMQLKFNQGKIRMISFHDSDLKVTDYTVDPFEVVARSFVQRQEPTEYMANEITITFDKQYFDNSYLEQITVTNEDSIARFGYMEKRFNYDLIHDYETAQHIVDYLLDEYSNPISILTFEMFFSAYQLEKGDVIFISEGYSGEGVIGQIFNVTRTYGKGKTGQINRFLVELTKPNSTIFSVHFNQNIVIDDSDFLIKTGRLLIHDFDNSLTVDDSDIYFGKGTNVVIEHESTLLIDDSDADSTLPIYKDPFENLVLDDSDIEFIITSGYGAGPYGDTPYGD